jgi:hypothetical protein
VSRLVRCPRVAPPVTMRPVTSRRLLRAALACATTVLAVLPACGLPPERAYYAPAGAELGTMLARHRDQSADAVLDVACQGAYVNRVDGAPTLTVHVQLEVSRPRSGDLRLRREDIVADVRTRAGQPRLALPLAEAWSGRERVDGDLVVPAWSLRPFDLFFDAQELVEAPRPESVVVRWGGEAAGLPVAGQCLFARIPSGDPRLPGEEPMEDTGFGLRAGYYLPGRVSFGARALRPSGEARLHYIFHQPGRWRW